jgi:hypothetical protein
MSRITIAMLALSALAGAQSQAPLHQPARPSGKHGADGLAHGYSLDARRPIGVFDAYATLSNGDRVVFDGLGVFRTTDDGTFVGSLGTVPSYGFPSFVVPDPTETYALVGESTDGVIYKVALSGASLAPLTDLDFNFEACFENSGHVLISAAPCGFFCGSEIYRVNVTTGAQTLVASVNGPSGPLARAANGDLYYIRQSDSFLPGTWSILRWTASQIGAGPVLLENDAALIAAGLDGGADLAIDHVRNHLLVAEAEFGSPSHVVEFDLSGTKIRDVVESANWLGNLELVFGAGPGSFEAYQPASGVTLRYRTTHYAVPSYSDIVTVRPRRPIASISGPGLAGPGDVTVSVEGGAPNGSLVMLLSPDRLYNPVETTYDLGTFLFHTGMASGTIHIVAEVPTDNTGRGSWTYHNRGTMQDTGVIQAWIKNSDGVRIGSSTTVFN